MTTQGGGDVVPTTLPIWQEPWRLQVSRAGAKYPIRVPHFDEGVTMDCLAAALVMNLVPARGSSLESLVVAVSPEQVFVGYSCAFANSACTEGLLRIVFRG